MSTSRCTFKRIEKGSQGGICTLMFIACPSADEWVTATCYPHSKEYYSALKRKEILV
jgi:hypothetical protein